MKTAVVSRNFSRQSVKAVNTAGSCFSSNDQPKASLQGAIGVLFSNEDGGDTILLFAQYFTHRSFLCVCVRWQTVA